MIIKKIMQENQLIEKAARTCTEKDEFLEHLLESLDDVEKGNIKKFDAY